MSINTDNAVYSFIAKYSTLPPDSILRGWQSSSLLPRDSEQYAVFTAMSCNRRGTNIATQGDDSQTLAMTSSYMYQIDVVTSNGLASEVITKLNIISRSIAGVDFFKGFNLSLLYGDNVRAIPMISTSEKYLQRYSMELYVDEVASIVIEQEYFDSVDISLHALS